MKPADSLYMSMTIAWVMSCRGDVQGEAWRRLPSGVKNALFWGRYLIASVQQGFEA